MIAVPDTGGQFSAWNYQEQFTYRGCFLELHYQTEPPHGDFVYSLTLPANRGRYHLPLWIYGRSLFFFGPSYLLAEGVPAGGYSGLKSVIIDLSSARYASLDSWYRRPQPTDQGLLLVRSHDSAPLLLTSSAPLNWNALHYERTL